MDTTNDLLQVLARCLSLVSHQFGGAQGLDFVGEAPEEPTVSTDVTAIDPWTATTSATPQEDRVVPGNQETWQAMDLANPTPVMDTQPRNLWGTLSQSWDWNQGVTFGDEGDTVWQGDSPSSTVTNQGQTWSQNQSTNTNTNTTENNKSSTQTTQSTQGNQTTVTMNPTIQIYATVREEADLDDLVSRIAQMLDEELASSAERAYT